MDNNNNNNPDLIKHMIEVIMDAQSKLTKDTLLLVESMPKTTELNELLEKLRISDEKIKEQMTFILRIDGIVRKYAK